MARTNQKFRDLIPPLSAEERGLLEASLLAEGCRDDVVCWGEWVVDGHNRVELCEKHGIKYGVRQRDFATEDEAKIWIINNQFGRRNLSAYSRGELALKLEPLLAAKAKKNMSDGGKGLAMLPNLNTREELAKNARVSDGTMAKVKLIDKHADEQTKAKLRANELTISEVAANIRHEERVAVRQEKERESARAQPIKAIIEVADALEWLPRQDKCDLLLADPPYSTDIEDVGAFAKEWLPLALSKVKPTGSAYVCIGAYPEEVLAYLNARMPTQILVWTYKNCCLLQPKESYNQNCQFILYYRGVEAPSLSAPSILTQFACQEITAPDGRQGDRYFKWQKPDELARRLIENSSRPGELVLDVFCGSGTFALMAARMGRNAKGCEIDPEVAKIARGRQ